MYEGIEDIYTLLKSERLKEALVQLEAICTQAPDWKLRSKVEELKTAYGYMLQYARQGVQDPNREKMRRQMRRTAYELTDWADIALQTPRSGDVYYQHLRTYQQHPASSYTELQMRLEAYTEDIGTVSILYADKQHRQTETEKICRRHEEALNELFNKTWTHLFWNEAEAEEVQQITDSLLIASNDKAVLVSAVMMSLLYLFDERKVSFLLKNCVHEDVQVSQRSLVGLVIVADRYRERIQLYPSLLSQFHLLHDNDTFRRHLFTVQMQLLMTRETSKITKKMNEDIIPGIMKAAKMGKEKISFEQKEDEVDINPEWEEWIDKSGVSDKIREMGNLQIEGADIYMSTFVMLKSFPFFNHVSHWFYPFDMNQADMLPITQKLGTHWLNTFSIMMETDIFCNSDKYSFCLTLANMPFASQEQAFQQMTAQMHADGEDQAKLQQRLNYSKNAKNISRQYIQDLYRFSKIWVSKHYSSGNDLFASAFCLWENPLVNTSLLQKEYLKGLADFLFHKGHHDDASTLYMKLAEVENGNVEIYQKIGYIQQKKKQYKNAIRTYEHANLLASDNVWTLKHLAQCHKFSYNYEQALSYYKQVEQVLPDDLNITQQTGECLVRLERYEEALAYFYKVEYLEKNPLQARRAIAWCSFCIGRYEEALKYYRLLLQEEHPQKQDWLNAGHVHWVKGNMEQAIAHYAEARKLCKDHTEFITFMEEDMERLTASGISAEDIRILLDLLV
ncbi:MAG: tetratricopeptide repeat protein [Bacteroides sp.]|nr:tetratricopeptide repeat protein [Bacteroides sp.]